MKCPACDWPNRDGSVTCFNCRASLGAADGAPTRAAVKSERTPSQPVPQAASSSGKPLLRTAAVSGRGSVSAADASRNVSPSGMPPRPGGVLAPQLQRAAALLIDLAAVLLVAVPLLILMYMQRSSLSLWLGPDAILYALLIVVLLASVPALMDSVSAGSLGKRMLGLRVIDARGGRPGLLRSAARHIIKLSMHGLLPVLWIWAERILLGGTMLHDWLCSTRVVHARSSAAQIAALLPQTFAPTMAGRVLRGAGAGALILLALLIFLGALSVTLSEPNPQRDAMRPMVKRAQLIAEASENHFYRDGRFPANLASLGIDLGDDFNGAELNPSSGALRLRVNSSLDELKGGSLILYPEFRQGSVGKIRKWRCGSVDIDRNHMPLGCLADVTHHAQ